MRIVLLAAAAFCLFAQSAGAQQGKTAQAADALHDPQTTLSKEKELPAASPTSSDRKVAEILIYYYISQDPTLVPVLIGAMRDEKTIARTGLSRPVIAGFLSAVFRQNRSRIADWIGDGKFPDSTKAIMEFALWQSGNAGQIPALLNSKSGQGKVKPTNLYTLRPRSAVEMDMKWGAFYATGNPGFVGAMVDFLDKSNVLTGRRDLDKAARMAAMQGLEINMRQHELIERYLRKRAAEAVGETRQTLEDMLARGNIAVKPGLVHDGVFWGLIRVDTPANIAKPSDATPVDSQAINNALIRARRAEVLDVAVEMAGMALAEDLSADVVMNTRVIRPDGTVYPNSESRALSALKEKIPTRFNTRESKSRLKILFEPDDRSGIYKIEVELIDNISGKKLSLNKNIELVDN